MEIAGAPSDGFGEYQFLDSYNGRLGKPDALLTCDQGREQRGAIVAFDGAIDGDDTGFDNLVTPTELESGEADPDLPRPSLLPASTGASPGSARLDVEVSSRFRPMQSVRARNLHPRGHIRLPRYTRGKRATVVRDHGVFALQDTDVNGQRLGARPQHVYTVRFTARELWGDRASARDTVYVDLWEDYLEPT